LKNPDTGGLALRTASVRFHKLVSITFFVVAYLSLVSQILLAESTNPWKHEIVFPDEPFEQRHHSGTANMGWIKFTIPKEANVLGPVTYQDSRTYELHYEFVTEHLDPFIGISPEEFQRVSLYEQDQQLILGAVVTPPKGYPLTTAIQEVGIQFVRSDPYAKEEIVYLFEIIKSTVIADPNVMFYYFPTFEQSNVARDHEEWFAKQGIPVSSPDRWLKGNVIYSSGWAFGHLKYFPSDQIQTAYLKGELLASDILLTDAIPAEIPVVAGIISLSPSTPNSHVAILAATYAIPFVYLTDESTIDQAMALLEHEVVLRATAQHSWDSQVDMIDTEGVLSEEQADQLLVLKQPPDLNIQPIASLGLYSISTEEINLHDIRYVGGKAAHYSLLRNAIRDNSRTAVAFTFDLWNEFLDQKLASGISLREDISGRLSIYTFPPANMAELEHDLSMIRSMFKDDGATEFSESLRDAVIETLTDEQYGFDANRKIRFRSSTNVEDSEHFTGAGLYDSYSGCLADDLDDDGQGSSHCDPNRDEERGVFRAIRKVFASFYNTNAFLERLRYQIDEDEVGMALLVHHSFPDEIELANGVATFDKSQSSSPNIQLVTQTGAVSVSNPDPGVVPEQVSSLVSSTGNVHLSLKQYSNLLPLGQKVMAWEQDYHRLSQLLVTAAKEYERATGKTEYVLDFEYKRTAPDGDLIVKQIRSIPQADAAPETPALLVSRPVELEVLQGEYGEIFANHRLKSVWLLNCQSMWLTEENLHESFFTDIKLEYVDAGQVHQMVGQLTSLPSFSHEPPLLDKFGYYQVGDSWLMPHLANQRSYTLQTTRIPSVISSGQCPVITLEDLQFECDTLYNRPVPVKVYTDTLCATSETTKDHVVLNVRPEASEDDILQTRTILDGDVTIQTQFYWPPHPAGPTAGYTAPVVRWIETMITGLTETPILLQSSYAQTYHPGHHNFWETFMFEPRLDQNVSVDILAELENQGIGRIIAFAAERAGIGICTYDSRDDDSSRQSNIGNDGQVDCKGQR
jgi:hypothetical protein